MHIFNNWTSKGHFDEIWNKAPIVHVKIQQAFFCVKKTWPLPLSVKWSVPYWISFTGFVMILLSTTFFLSLQTKWRLFVELFYNQITLCGYASDIVWVSINKRYRHYVLQYMLLTIRVFRLNSNCPTQMLRSGPEFVEL